MYFSLFIHSSTETTSWLFPSLGNYEKSCHKPPYASFCVDVSFQFPWVNTEKHNYWIMWYVWASLVGSDGKGSAWNAGDPGLFPGSGRSPGEGNGYPLQYSCLENSTDRGVWKTTVHGIAHKCFTVLLGSLDWIQSEFRISSIFLISRNLIKYSTFIFSLSSPSLFIASIMLNLY